MLTYLPFYVILNIRAFFVLRKFLPSLLLLANGESITYSE